MSGRGAIGPPIVPPAPREAARGDAIRALIRARSDGLTAVDWRHEKIGRWVLGFHFVRPGQKPTARELLKARRRAAWCLGAGQSELWACRPDESISDLAWALDGLLDAVEALVEAGYAEIQGSPGSRQLWSYLVACIPAWREGRHV